VSVELANILRVVTVGEIGFTLGFLAYRVWDRHSIWQYLTMMALALAVYSTLAATVLIARYNESATWKLPIVTLAATFACLGVIRKGGKKVNNG
jgi:hypothetical protein